MPRLYHFSLKQICADFLRVLPLQPRPMHPTATILTFTEANLRRFPKGAPQATATYALNRHCLDIHQSKANRMAPLSFVE
jgi:hypothetical protein